MNFSQKAVVWVLSLLLFSSWAYGFSAVVQPVKDEIFLGESAVFDLTISNKGGSLDHVRVYSLHYPDWDLISEPLQNPIILELPAGGEKSIRLLVDPLHITESGKYILTLNLKSQFTQQQIKLPIAVFIRSPYEQKGYVPTVLMDVDVPKTIDPRGKIPVKLFLDNQNILNITDLLITLHSNLINTELENSLAPKEKKTVEITASMDPLTEPQADVMEVRLLWRNQTIAGPVIKTLDIGKYQDIKQEEKIEKRFFKSIRHITFTNNGNLEYTQPLRVETSFLKRIFTGSTPKARLVREDGKSYLVWEGLTIPPMKSLSVKVYESYRGLLLIIVLGIIALILYYVYRSPLVLVKNAADVRHKEGGISELKVVLHVKNRGQKPIQHIEVTDKIPQLGNMEKEVSIGTLQPVKVLRHEQKDTLAKWQIEGLEPQDERVISYRIKAKLHILGGLTLPAAVGRCSVDGKHSITYSNKVDVEKEIPGS